MPSNRDHAVSDVVSGNCNANCCRLRDSGIMSKWSSSWIQQVNLCFTYNIDVYIYLYIYIYCYFFSPTRYEFRCRVPPNRDHAVSAVSGSCNANCCRLRDSDIMSKWSSSWIQQVNLCLTVETILANFGEQVILSVR